MAYQECEQIWQTENISSAHQAMISMSVVYTLFPGHITCAQIGRWMQSDHMCFKWYKSKFLPLVKMWSKHNMCTMWSDHMYTFDEKWSDHILYTKYSNTCAPKAEMCTRRSDQMCTRGKMWSDVTFMLWRNAHHEQQRGVLEKRTKGNIDNKVCRLSKLAMMMMVKVIMMMMAMSS